MKGCRFPALVLLLAATALAAGPSLRLQAASPCAGGPPMACCGGEAESDATPPCGCTLEPATPQPATVVEAAPNLVLEETKAPSPEPEPPASARAAVPASPRSRSAPLFLLFSTFLN